MVPSDAPPFQQFLLRPEVVVPGSVWRTARSVESGRPVGLEALIAATDRLRFMEGRRDPADASSFSIEYTHNDVVGIIDGHMSSDETVTLMPRTGEVIEVDANYRFWSPDSLPPLPYTLESLRGAVATPCLPAASNRR